MQATSTDFLEGISSSPYPPQIKVLLAYQDLRTGLRAREFLDHVLEGCQTRVEPALTLWNLAMFHLPEIREEAVRSACEANLVLLSLGGEHGFEPQTEMWLNEWIARRDDDECALAVLIHSDVQGLHSVGHALFWLQQITRPTQVRLFVGFMPSTTTEGVSLAKAPFQDGELGPFVGQNILRRLDAHAEGGLNE
jgi:hypothetical protein